MLILSVTWFLWTLVTEHKCLWGARSRVVQGQARLELPRGVGGGGIPRRYLPYVAELSVGSQLWLWPWP